MTIKSQFTKSDVKPVFTGNADFVQLPFPTLRIAWVNGNPQAERTSAKYFGGWQCGFERAAEDLNTLGLQSLPAYFSEVTTWINDKGKEYQAFSSRFVLAAPILAKDDWWEEFDNKRNINVKRHRLDMLVYLATMNEKKNLLPYSPAVLSATGFAASAIKKAFLAWPKDNADKFNQFAPDVPSMFFYVNVGTFGDTRITEPAGDSVYVPCQYSKKEVTEQLLEALHVGVEVEAQIVSYQAQAASWFGDTHANRNKTYVPEPAAARGEPTYEDAPY